MRVSAILGGSWTRTRGTPAMARARRGCRVVAAASALLSVAGLALVASSPASAVTAAPARAEVVTHHQAASHHTAAVQRAATAKAARTSAHPASAAHAGYHAKARARGSFVLPADVKAVCGTPARGHAECQSLLRTNVKAHKGLFTHDTTPSGYGPSDLQSAYDLPSATAGSGETVAVVDAGGDPTAASDLATYRAQYGLPACTTANGCFEQVNQEGQQGNYPPTDGDWPVEESLDIDMVSAICPNCHILLVEADSTSVTDMGPAVDEAVALGARYVSNSYIIYSEPSDETSYDHYYDHPGVAITAAAGDEGYGVGYPAASPYVTSVGGTTLTQAPGTARGWTETAWDGTGSGCSAYEPKPGWQHDTGCSNRTDNDVSADADPDTGVAIYDTTGEGGWLEVGGTSAATPVIASTYALAGTPLAGTNPASYPYLNASGDLNDVTSGSNGTCTPAYLCTAGPGYDGPTGLGTPDGTTAFTPVTSGTLSGTITSAATGQPISGATVSVGHVSVTTTSSGSYSMILAAGSYSVTVTAYGYVAKSATVQVTAGQASSQDFALGAAPEVTLSGKVTDGSGHKWPLYAAITLTGTPLAPVYTSPYTGLYSVTVPAEDSYTLDVAPVEGGYATAAVTAKVGKSNATRNIQVAVNPSVCDAPGYAAAYAGGGTQFTGWTGSTPKDGWTVTANSGGNGHTWVFGSNPTHESTSPQPPDSDGQYAIADSYHYSSGTLDTSLVSPVANLSSVASPAIGFDSSYYEYGTPPESAEVDLSLDGGQTWTSVWQQTTSSQQGPVTIPIPQAAGQTDVRVRFTYTGTYDWWWSLDNVYIGTETCAAVPGGLVAGTVTAASSGNALNGATITGKNHGSATAATTSDPAIPGGFYTLFSPAGTHELTAADTGYAASTQAVHVARNAVTHQDWALQAGHLTLTPDSGSVTEPMGAAKTVKLTLGNDGTAPVQVSLGAQDGAYTPASGTAGSGPTPPGTVAKSPAKAKAKATAAPAWTKITKYPVPVKYNAVAEDPLTGEVYSVGGINAYQGPDTASGYVYDPASGKWSPIAPAPAALQDADAAFIDGTLYLAGGYNKASGSISSAVYAYLPGANIWSQVSSMPDALYGGAVAVLDGQLYVIGGCDPAGSTSGCRTGSQAAYRYDPQASTWTKIARYPIAVQEEACAGIDGELACAGGASTVDDGDAGTSATYLYDPASNAWRQGTDLPFPDYGMAYAAASGDLQVTTGFENSEGVKAPSAQYDPSANAWSTLPAADYNVIESGGSCGMYQIGGGKTGVVDGVGGYGSIPTQDAEVLTGYGQCDGAGALSWLSESQDSLTIDPGRSVTVRVQMDSAQVSQPGSYQATLYAATNTPSPPQVANVTMSVTPAQGMREVAGTVTTTAGKPVQAATVAITAAEQAAAAVQTNASGHYQWWLAGGTGGVQVSAARDGYQPQAASVSPAPGAPAAADFVLKPDPGPLPYTGTAAGSSRDRQATTTAATATAHASPAGTGSGSRPGHAKGSAPAGGGLPAGVKAVCAKPASPEVAQCDALVRTDVTPHRGRFAPDQAPPGYGPSDLQSAYDLPSATAGSGETVAVIDAYDNPNAEADLQVYRAQYGLPVCDTANGCFEKVNQEGQQGNYPAGNSSWAEEESLDVDMVSAICPNCHIILVEADTDSTPNLGASVNEAVALGAKFISNSYGTSYTSTPGSGESKQELTWDSEYYDHPGIAVTASAGDSGYGVHYPAASPNVTSVGGTTLTQDPGTTRGWSETVWGSSSDGAGTGSGCSVYEPKPAWQAGIGCGMRTVADVSADANPDTGVAFYDSSASGWGVVGGTSVSSPIIASVYALAGTPAAGTYPASYPYVNTGGGLNDVTSGANGTCSPAYLCTAGPGYDGPTGLGTPDGVSAFTPTAYGTLSGTVTSQTTGDPMAGATVSVGSRSATTDASGHYSLDVATGSQSVTAADFDYVSQTATGVQVTAGQTVTQDFALAQAKVATVSGTVTDGSGHKWPLYAQITIPGDPNSPVYTNPDTGDYSITLPVHTSWTLTVTPVYPGYTAVTDTVKVDGKDITRNITIDADVSACIAPGYDWKYKGTGTDFTGWTGTTPQDGWKNLDTEGNGEVWAFDDPGLYGNLTGGTGAFAEIDSGLYPGTAAQDTSLESPVANLSAVSAPEVGFDSAYLSIGTNTTADVDLSLDGGQTWTTVWKESGLANVKGPVTIPIPKAAGHSDVRVRFTYMGGAKNGLWELDNIFVGTEACAATPGGLVTGVVTDTNTGAPVNGAAVTATARPGGTGTTVATSDPAIPGGFYWLFSPAGKQSLTATATGYASASAYVDVARNAVTRQDWVLQAGSLSVSPASPSLTETLGQAGTVKLTYTNTGSSALQIQLGSQDGGFTPATGPSGGARAAVSPARSSWTSIAPYPSPVSASAVATDPQTGAVYSVGGSTYGYDATATTAAGYAYDPSTGQWSPIASLPQPVGGAAAVFVDGTLYVIGGATVNADNVASPVATVYAYNLGANSWSQAASLPQAVDSPGIAVLDGQIYVIGGCTSMAVTGLGMSCNGGTVALSYRYNPATGAWTRLAHYPIPVGEEACAGIDGEVACTGGDEETTAGSDTATRLTWLYDPASNHWTQGTDLPYPDQQMAYSGADGELQVAGGETGSNVYTYQHNYTDRVSQYNPATNTWTALPALANTVVNAGGGCGMYVIGGVNLVTPGQNYDGLLQAAEQLPGYDQCDGAGDTGWVKPSQFSLTLAPGASATVTVRLDSAKVTQPGTYQAMIYAAANAPYPVQVTTVTMVVQPPAGWIRMSGEVTSASGTPIPGATVQIDTSASSVKTGLVDYPVITGTDGRYQWWLDPGTDDPLQVIAAKDGYIQQVVTLKKPRPTLGFKLSPFPSVPY